MENMEVKIKPNRLFNLALFFACAILCALFCLPIIFIRVHNIVLATFVYATCGIFAVIFLLIALFFFLHAIRIHPVLVINDYGIKDSQTLNRVGLIAWSEIQSCSLDKYGWLDILVIKVRDYGALNGRMKFLTKLNKDIYNNRVIIPVTSLKIEPKKLEEIVNIFLDVNKEKEVD